MRTKILILTVLMSFLTTSLFPQKGSVAGKVTDAETSEPLIGTTVFIEGTTMGTTTDVDGNYNLNLDAGSYKIAISYTGYLAFKQDVTITADETLNVNAVLHADFLNLEQVVITGVVNQKSSLESSVALSSMQPKFIEELGAQTTAEIFKAIPGIRSESSGGEGNANIAVRGVPVASGGSKFLQLQEDGLPVLQFGDISFGNADIFLRTDQTIARIEALKGGSASTFASNSPAGIINFISKTGSTAGGAIGTTIGMDYNSLRTDFEYGSPINDNLRFHIGGFTRQGTGPRDPGYTANYGGQIKANLTRSFENGYARVYFKYLNDRVISYMPMPVKVTGSADEPTFESIEGFDLTNSTLQSTGFMHVNGVDGAGNSRTSNISDGMHPEVMAFGSEFSFDVGDGWQLKNKSRMAFTKGTFNSPFPAQVGSADAIATDIAGAGYTLSYANGTNAGVALTPDQISNLNNNGLLMRVHLFDTEMKNLNNFTNDLFVTKYFGLFNVTVGYYKAYQKIAMNWLWQTYLTDVSSDTGPRLMNIASADNSFYSKDGLTAHGVPAWGNCCTRGYDVMYLVDAPYANLAADITDQLNIEASARYDFGGADGFYFNNQQAQVDVDNNGIIEPTEQSVTVLDNARPNPVDYEYSYLSYSVGSNFKISDDMAVYGRYSKGGRANADRLLYTSFINADGSTIDGLDADEISQAELGYKLKSSTFSTIITGFYTNISEQNEEFGKAINKDFNTYGAEIEAIASIQKLNVMAGATFTKASIKKSINSDEVGNTPRRVPTLMYSLSPSYSFLNGKANIGFTLIGTTKVYAQDDNNIVIPAYAYMNVFAGYTIIKGLSVRVNSNNITNALGFTEMEGDAYTAGATNYMRARPISGRASTFTLLYKF
jgi:outer membrane receptor protein involved in Fe transport